MGRTYILHGYDESHIFLKAREVVERIKWDEVGAIFAPEGPGRPTNFYRLVIIETEDGGSYTVKIVKNSRLFYDTFYQEVLQGLSRRFPEISSLSFSHSQEWIQQRFYGFKTFRNVMLILLGGIILWGSYYGFTLEHENLKGRWVEFAVYVGLFFGSIFLSLFLVYEKSRAQTVIKNLTVNDKEINWTDESGRRVVKCLSEVDTFTLDRYQGKLKFADGVKLNSLETLYYWPLLREHLLVVLGGRDFSARCARSK